MSDKTGIEWADATWNPITGCTKVSEGCRNCYAMTFTERFEGTPGHYFESGFKVTLRPEKLDQPYRWKRPRRIFVNSMSDLFHPDVPFDFIGQVFSVMGYNDHHTFMVLTKRPARMLEFMKWYHEISKDPISPSAEPYILPNVWIGVSVENQQAADERIPLLLQTPAAVKFLSCEPLLGPVNIRGYLMEGKSPGKCGNCGKGHGFTRCLNYGGIAKVAVNHGCSDFKRVDFAIDWVIVGGESGLKARPMHPDWARELRDQCQAAEVPFFFKQWGEWAVADCGNYEVGKHQIQMNDRQGNDHSKTPHEKVPADAELLARIGKKAAGRLLDGRTWDEYPEEVKA